MLPLEGLCRFDRNIVGSFQHLLGYLKNRRIIVNNQYGKHSDHGGFYVSLRYIQDGIAIYNIRYVARGD